MCFPKALNNRVLIRRMKVEGQSFQEVSYPPLKVCLACIAIYALAVGREIALN